MTDNLTIIPSKSASNEASVVYYVKNMKVVGLKDEDIPAMFNSKVPEVPEYVVPPLEESKEAVEEFNPIKPANNSEVPTVEENHDKVEQFSREFTAENEPLPGMEGFPTPLISPEHPNNVFTRVSSHILGQDATKPIVNDPVETEVIVPQSEANTVPVEETKEEALESTDLSLLFGQFREELFAKLDEISVEVKKSSQLFNQKVEEIMAQQKLDDEAYEATINELNNATELKAVVGENAPVYKENEPVIQFPTEGGMRL